MKKILLFILLELICFCLFVGSLWVYNNSMSLSGKNQTTVTIMSGNPQNDSLILDPNTIPDVFKGRKVTWIIAPSSNVDSFGIEMKKGSNKIFILFFGPSSEYNKQTSGMVYPRYLIGNDKMFDYNIYWKMKGDPEKHTFDPKLAVKSTGGFTPIELLIYILSGILFLLPFSVFRNKKVKAK